MFEVQKIIIMISCDVSNWAQINETKWKRYRNQVLFFEIINMILAKQKNILKSIHKKNIDRLSRLERPNKKNISSFGRISKSFDE